MEEDSLIPTLEAKELEYESVESEKWYTGTFAKAACRAVVQPHDISALQAKSQGSAGSR